MSTKTTFKRIALVAVAALGLSVLSVAPSTAAADSVTLGATASDATTAVAVTNTISLSAIAATGTAGETITATVVLLSAPLTSTLPGVLPAVSITATQSAAGVNADSSTATGVLNVWAKAAGRYTAAGTITVTPDVPGVYVYRITPSNVGASNTTAQTWTVTAVAPTVKSTTAFLNTNLAAASTADASSLAFPAAASVTARGRLTVQQYSTTDTATPATTAISQAVVVAIDKGLVSATNDYFTGAKSVTTAAATAGPTNYYVFSNGDVGTASLTVTVGGVLVSTKTITFQGVATSLSAALATNAANWIAPTGTTTVNVTAKDSAGNAAVALPTTMTATPASTAIATATINSSTGVVTITGVAAGTTVITIADSATTAPAASATYTVTVAPAASATLPTLTFDKAEYNAGELMTITIGAAAADNATFAAFSALPASSLALVTVKNPFVGGNTGSLPLVAGKNTWTAYAPITAGPITITATSAGGTSVAATAVTATATVVSDGIAQAAADAAAEAKDAADAATDAANEAAAAADAATAAAQDAADAVNDLAASVSAMITALRKQITALTNLVIKIQKKVRA
jgi:trimeric autotransporter adhesin